MQKYLEKESEITFDKIFNQILGKFHFWYGQMDKVGHA